MDLWEEANIQVSEAISSLKEKNFSELSNLVENDILKTININDKELTHWSRAEQENNGSLSVIVEIRRERKLGLSQVSANGFFIFPDGRIEEMQEQDMWDHGY